MVIIKTCSLHCFPLQIYWCFYKLSYSAYTATCDCTLSSSQHDLNKIYIYCDDGNNPGTTSHDIACGMRSAAIYIIIHIISFQVGTIHNCNPENRYNYTLIWIYIYITITHLYIYLNTSEYFCFEKPNVYMFIIYISFLFFFKAHHTNYSYCCNVTGKSARPFMSYRI